MLAVLSLLLCCDGPPPGGGPAGALGHSRLLVFHSEDGQIWSQEPEPLATGFDSLGLSVEGQILEGQSLEGQILEGQSLEAPTLILTGLDHSRRIPWWERYEAPSVQTIERVNGVWIRGQRAFPELDGPALIDPQLDPGGLWHVTRQGTGDPALGGENRVLHGATVVLTGPGLADPMGVSFQGQELLFTTLWGQGVVLWSGSRRSGADSSGSGHGSASVRSGSLHQRQSWPQLTVPYARVEGETLELYAVGVVSSRRLPVVLRSADGERFSQPQALKLEPTPTSCTSPVVHHGADGWWLFCVEEGAP